MTVRVIATARQAAAIDAALSGHRGVVLETDLRRLRDDELAVIEDRPPIDGLSAVAALRRRGCRCHIVLLMPDGGDDAFLVAAGSGADDWLLGQWSPDELRTRVETGVRAHARRRGGLAPDSSPAPAHDPPGDFPQGVLDAAAAEASAITGGDAGFVFRFVGSRAVLQGIAGAEQSPVGAWFEMLPAGVLPLVHASGAPVRTDRTPRPIGREQSGSWYISAVYVSATGAPVRLGRRLWGALVAARTDEEPFGSHVEQRLATLAHDRALAIVNAADRARVARLATADLETGLLARGAFLRRLSALGAEAERNGIHLGVLRALVTATPPVSPGAVAGPHAYVMSELGRRLAGMARAGDVVGRLSTAEVAWAIAGASPDLAGEAGERLRRDFEGAAFPALGPLALRVGASQVEDGRAVGRALAAAGRDARSH